MKNTKTIKSDFTRHFERSKMELENRSDVWKKYVHPKYKYFCHLLIVGKIWIYKYIKFHKFKSLIGHFHIGYAVPFLPKKIVRILRTSGKYAFLVLKNGETHNIIVWQFATKLHLIGNFHKLAQIYFIVLLKTSPTYKGVDPPLAPPPTLINKHVL